MNLKTPMLICLVLLATCALGAFGWHEYSGRTAAAPNPYFGGNAADCKAGPGEICPSQEQLNLWARSKDLQKEINVEMNSPTLATRAPQILSYQDEQDLWLGQQVRFSQGVPHDPLNRPYAYDESKKKFIAPPMPQQPAAAPVKPPAKK